MAISQTVVLPAQPDAGHTEYIPLGGDGWISPGSSYAMDLQVTGDASGGLIVVTINPDVRFEAVVAYMQLQNNNPTAQEYLFGLNRLSAGGSVNMHNSGTMVNVGMNSLDDSNILWEPPPVIAPTAWSFITNNVDTIAYRYAMLIYNFNIRASEKVPLGIIFGSLPRTSAAL